MRAARGELFEIVCVEKNGRGLVTGGRRDFSDRVDENESPVLPRLVNDPCIWSNLSVNGTP